MSVRAAAAIGTMPAPVALSPPFLPVSGLVSSPLPGLPSLGLPSPGPGLSPSSLAFSPSTAAFRLATCVASGSAATFSAAASASRTARTDSSVYPPRSLALTCAITAAAGLHGRSRPRNHVDILRFIYGHRFLSPLKIGHPIVAQPLSLPAVSDCPVCQSQPRAR